MKHYTNRLYWVAIAVLFGYFAYTKGWILANFETITPKQAYQMLQDDHNVTLLDVRTQQEFTQGHISGAKLIPLSVLSENLTKLNRDKNKKVIVYCHSGNRSIAASRILEKQGFVPLNLGGGITEWIRSGLPVAKEHKAF
ncbi:MAG: rhodanese-like domain-containing protein [Campylobacterales bacterium]|nr:rhodanese-like domain-containing protein [Campylobacterales bacterium]